MNQNAEPAEKFAELSPETRRFIAGLDEEDIATLDKGIELVRMAVTFGKVTKWLFIGIIGIFFGLVMLWDAVLKFIGFFRA